MKLRPARSVRKINSQAWSRYSRSKPKKNYIKSMPHTSLLIFNMGTRNDEYDVVFRLASEQDVRLRSNALEAARQVANKYLEREIPNDFSFRVVPYPHNIVREKKMAMGAGADRISQGMTLAFGKASAVAARVFAGETVFEIKTFSTNRKVAHKAMERAASKLSGTYKIKVDELKKPVPKAA